MQINVRQAAQLLNVSEKTVYRWIKEGTLPAYRINDQYRIQRYELLEWATRRQVPISEEIFHEPEVSEEEPSLEKALDAGGIFYRIEGNDKNSILQSIVRTMKLPDNVDLEFLHRALIAREEMCSTALGDGIAIPHPRNPIILHVTQPSITLCFLEKPVDFDALDGKLVNVLFTLISHTVRAHLRLLFRLSFALQDKKFKSVISNPGTREKILSEAHRIDEILNQKMSSHTSR